MESYDLLKELLVSDRSIRRFKHSRPIGRDVLLKLVDLTRYCASGRNLQPLRYCLVVDQDKCSVVFPTLAWAGYYKDWAGPEPEERPVAYLVQCLDTELASTCLCDDGLQLQAITLGAAALGLGACIIKSFNKAKLINILDIPERYMPLYVLALGYPAETAAIVPMKEDGDIRYYRDSSDRQCVPKRSLDDIII